MCKNRRFALTLGWFVAMAWTSVAAASQAAEQSAQADRAEAIRKTLAGVDKTLKAAGGTWEAWAEKMKPFREDMQRIVKEYKWPWPAKGNLCFQGKSVELLMADTLDAWRPFEAIVHWDRQLKARGIDLIVMPIPSKLSIYPDYFSEKAPENRIVEISTKHLVRRLLENDIEVVDLHALYREYRRQNGDDPYLYYDRDGHWRNLAVQLAAQELASRLKRYGFVQEASAKNPYASKPGSRSDGPKADRLRLIFEQAGGRPCQDAPDSPIVLTGDSHAVYNANRGAGLTAQVAFHVGLPLTLLATEGLGPDMPVAMAQLEKERGFLAGRRVVIWSFTERSFPRARDQVWPVVSLPEVAGRKPAATVTRIEARATVAMAGLPPAKNAPYAHYIMRLYVTDLVDAGGKKIGTGDGVLRILAMRHRIILPIAKAAKGDGLAVKLTSWAEVQAKYGKIQSEALPDIDLEIDKPHYWAELPDQPALDAKDLSVVGEDAAPKGGAGTK
ncbi:MAG: hypothetical protein ABR915_00120 [Thermoguttaceae bacterium]|jgi:alginate O-acetyltransferase complex protein AlgJ